MPQYNSSLHKIKVNTWGTQDKTGNGLDDFAKKRLFGENVGHASIEMTLSPTDETLKLIEKYCMEKTFEDWKEEPRKQQDTTFEMWLEEKHNSMFNSWKLDNNSTFEVWSAEHENRKNLSFEQWKIERQDVTFEEWKSEKQSTEFVEWKALDDTRQDISFEEWMIDYHKSDIQSLGEGEQEYQAREILEFENWKNERQNSGFEDSDAYYLHRQSLMYEEWKIGLQADVEERQNANFDDYIKTAERRLPFQLVEHVTRMSTFDDEGKLTVNADEEASRLSFYKIDFSFWPGVGKPFALLTTEEDMIKERSGHHFEYSDTAKEYFKPEERIHRGRLGSQVMTYAPMSITHQRDMNDENFERIELAIELQKLTGLLETEELLVQKINALKSPKIDGSLDKICKNMSFDTTSLLQEYRDINFLTQKDEIDLDEFKSFLLKKTEEHLGSLSDRQSYLREQIQDIDEYYKQKEYLTLGIPPDNTQELPYRTAAQRGLDPEAMLKKMRELTEPDALKFDLNTKNCSKTVTAVLKAGAADDAVLAQALSEEALGTIGTPQQVLGNVKRAHDIILFNKQNTFWSRIENINILNQASKKLVGDYQAENASAGKKALAVAGIIGIAILKTPGVLIQALINPSDTMNYIYDVNSTIYKNANSMPLKIASGFLTLVSMIILAPFILLEACVKLIAAPFKALSNWINSRNKKDVSAELDLQIIGPLSSKITEQDNFKSYNKMSSLLNAQTAATIKGHTREVRVEKTSATDILAQFEIDLENTTEVVTLNQQDFDKLNKYVREAQHPATTVRFQKCCDESLNRANRLSSVKQSAENIIDKGLDRENTRRIN